MHSNPPLPLCEHPLDVLSFVCQQYKLGKRCALAMLVGAIGGSVRAKGAIMAISDEGETCGYLSGGCIDADIRLRALTTLDTGDPQTLRYGQGSPFLDITLPCGGGIDVTVCPNPDLERIKATINALKARSSATFTLKSSSATAHNTVTYIPKLRIRIAGRSTDPIALANISVSAGFETELWSADSDCLKNAMQNNALKIQTLTTQSALPAANDDPYTAFVLMMHDQDWEASLLEQTLKGPAFYIGAVGSPNTHAKRCKYLLKCGLPPNQISHIKGPIGLVPSMRDASMLAISALAEIIGAYHDLPVEASVSEHRFENA